MAISRRFIARNGLDNNNQTISNVGSPTVDSDAATRGFSRNAGNLDTGTLLAARLPAHTGDVTSAAGSAALTLANSGVTAGTYSNATITVDAKGRVTSASSGAGGSGLTAGSTSTGYINYNGTTPTAGQWDGATGAASTSTTRLNYSGRLRASMLDVTNGSAGTLSLMGGTSISAGGGTLHGKFLDDSDYSFLAINGSVVSLGTRRSTNSATELLRLEGTLATVQGSMTVNGTLYASAYSGITYSNVVNALGYTPYNSTNPNGYTSNTGTVTYVGSGSGMNFTSFSGSGTVSMGTPSTSSRFTSNSVSGSTHTHAIDIPLASYTTDGLIAGSGTQYISGVKSFQTTYIEVKSGGSEAQVAVGPSGAYVYGNFSAPIGFYYSGAKAYLSSSGVFTSPGGFSPSASDISLKTDIRLITDATERILKLRGCTYEMKARPGVREIGVIAQEVEKVVPEVVAEIGDGIKGVHYGHLAALFIESIKDLKEEIDKLKAEVASLRGS